MANPNNPNDRMAVPPTNFPQGIPGTNRPSFPQGVPDTNQPSFDQVPRSAPPNTIPQRTAANARIDAGSIQNCVGNFTYIWTRSGSEFWVYPIMISQRSLSGFRWDRRFGWVYYGINLNRIESFFCVPY